MNVLIGCETSGKVREAFRRLGHEAYSCDLLPADDDSRFHIQADLNMVINYPRRVLGGHRMLNRRWDLLIAHPPCTYLCSSGLHWNIRRPDREIKTREALEFVRLLMRAPIDRIAIENPIGCIGTQIRKADQTIQPYQFGHDARKATQLWLVNLPKLEIPHEENWIAPRIVNGRPRWGNQTDSGQNRLTPSPDRWKKRSETYAGIADAMAQQWGKF